ncbi:hypothetical protein [Enterobacter kobei]|uniref:hypothetical protein n=1 Tax=Enterobacter kobei TaxID=208224 RepID=UPI002174E38F|nr:hypothetical protein [Enterobacter kobei]
MNNKELINAGHALAKAISNDTPLIEIAKMVSNLATQLDVQTARANVLADDNAKAMLAMKQADEAVKLGHSKFVGLVAENEVLKESVAELVKLQGKPVMFIDGDISPADAEKLAAVIREFNEETETPAARMARIIRENPHPTNMCDMPAAAGKGERA